MTALKTYIVSAILAIVFNAQDTLWATPNHPFWHKGHYVEASALHTGDTIEALEGGYDRIQQIIPFSGERRVYNFTVAENSNYYVGSRGVLVHNDCFLKRLTDSPELIARIDALPDALKGQFIQDFYEAGEDVIKVLKEKPGCVKAREGLYEAGYSKLRKNPVSLQKSSTLLENPALINSGLDETLVKRAIAGNRNAGAGAAALDALTDGLNSLVNSGTTFENFPRLLSDLEKGGGFAEGAGWIQKYIVTNTSEFAGKKLEFEIGVISGRVDLRIGSNLFEFKSVSTLPPSSFTNQVARDLKNVTSLDQIKWYFDGSKLPNGISQTDKDAMLSALESMDLTPDVINKFVPQGTIQDLVNVIETKFTLIFQVK